MTLLSRFAFLLGVLVLGFLGRRFGVLTVPVTERLNKVAFYVVLPALVFNSTYDVSVSTLLSPTVVAGQLLLMAAIVVIAWLVHRRIEDRGKRGVAIAQSYHGNMGYLGLPIVATTLGDASAGTASVILTVGVLTHVPLTVFFLTVVTNAEADMLQEMRKVLYNPVLLGIAAGMLVSFLDLSIPGAAATTVATLSAVALPIALLLVGSSLKGNLPKGEFGTLGTVIALKLLVMPLLAWGIYGALGVSSSAFAAAVMMFGAPTAISTYIYSEELGGDSKFASRTIFLSTLLWTGTVFVLLALVG